MIVRGISYAGCGFKGTYHFGATAALKNHLGSGPLSITCNKENKMGVALPLRDQVRHSTGQRHFGWCLS